MILDYSSYVYTTGTSRIVNFKTVKNALDELYAQKGICPFCHNEINNKIYYKYNDKIEWCSDYEEEDVIQCPNCGWWEHSYVLELMILLTDLEQQH